MMETNDPDFFEHIAGLAEQIRGLADDALPGYEDFTDRVIRGQIKELKQIEHHLDNMLTFCFDDRILSLFKRVLRKLYKQYPETVYSYIMAYREMYESDGGDDE